MAEKENLNIRWFDVTDSTNSSLARERLDLPQWSIHAARLQTAGRGQRGNCWQSAEGQNLTFSILLKPFCYPVTEHFAITQAVTLGIVGYLAAHGISATIKWPNDIYVGDRKVCGILIENFLKSANLAECIVGIGLNLNQREFDPSAPNPTSLALLKGDGASYAPEEELPKLVEMIRTEYEKIPERTAELRVRYLERLYRRGEWHEYLDCRNDDSVSLIPTTEAVGGVRIRGCIEGVTEEGLLKMKIPEGKSAEFAFKELRYII